MMKETYRRGRKVVSAIYLYEGQIEMLNKLSAKTGIPKAEYIREGVDLVLDKHRKELRAKPKKREERSPREEG